jgi:hypothetical protein
LELSLWIYTFDTFNKLKTLNESFKSKQDLLLLLNTYQKIQSSDMIKKEEIEEIEKIKELQPIYISSKIKKVDVKQQRFSSSIIEDSNKLKSKDYYIDYSKVYITEESKYSSLLPRDIEQVNHILKNWFDVNSISSIIDATSHIGLDTIHMNRLFKNATIDSYELNKDTFQLLSHNVSKLCNDKVHIHHQDFTTISLRYDINIVYIDAPWGGRNYKEKKDKQLFLSEINIIIDNSHLLSMSSLFYH